MYSAATALREPAEGPDFSAAMAAASFASSVSIVRVGGTSGGAAISSVSDFPAGSTGLAVAACAEGARRAAHAPPASAKINNPTARAAARRLCGRLSMSVNPRSSSVLAVQPALATLDVEQEKHDSKNQQNNLIRLHPCAPLMTVSPGRYVVYPIC